jgi:hypothetical protein
VFRLLASVGGVAVLGFAGTSYVLMRPMSSIVSTETYEVPAATASELETVAGLRVFFGHQSVGANMMAALPAVFAKAGVEAPEIGRSEELPAGTEPVFLHTNVGRNGDPLGKIAAFDSAIRSGIGESIDVALFKFCYVDFQQSTDVEKIFAAYSETMAALERDYPDVVFIYATAPLTIELGGVDRAKARVKNMLGRNSSVGPENNVVREEFNARIREVYGGTGRLFDIAAVQSTAEDGSRPVRSHDGDTFFAMEEFLASDPGHLNPNGAAIVASSLMALIADAVS